MADGDTKYEVAAFLRLKGNFAGQMKMAARAAGPLQSSLQKMAAYADGLARKMNSANRSIAKGIGLLVGAGAVAGMANVAKGGVSFAEEMENSAMSIATMFQLFGKADSLYGSSIKKTERWAKNLELAKLQIQEFLIMQRETPAGAKELITLYSAAAPGLANVTASLREQDELVKTLSMMGPTVGNDFRQLGSDLNVMLGGAAGQEDVLFRTLKPKLMDALKEAKLLKSNFSDMSKFTEKWNKDFTIEQRFNAISKSVAALGPKVKEAFMNSMAGLKSSSSTNLTALKLAVMLPMHEGYKAFLKRINSDKSNVFGKDAFAGWVKILTKFGNFAAKGADKFLRGVEKAAGFIRSNWGQIEESIKLGFAGGVLLVKAMLAKAVFGAIVGPILAMISKVKSGGSGAISGAKKLFEGFDARARKQHRNMGRSFVGGKGKGIGGLFGKGVRALVGGNAGTSGMRNVGAQILKLGALFGALTVSLAPLLFVLAPFVLAIGAVGVVIAGLSAYIIDSWKSIAKSIVDNMDGTIKPAIRAVVAAGMRLWLGLVNIGKQLFGASTGSDFLVKALGFLEFTLKAVAGGIALFFDIGAGFMSMVSTLEQVFGAFFNMMMDSAKQIKKYLMYTNPIGLTYAAGSAIWGDSDLEKRKSEESSISNRMLEASKNSASTSATLTDMAAKFRAVQNAPLAKVQEKKVDDITKKISRALLDLASGKGKKKQKVPTSGVHVENMYTSLDLRNQDPDRVMTAFLPELERLNDKRVQSYDALQQGV